jgi:hypothetical protein
MSFFRLQLSSLTLGLCLLTSSAFAQFYAPNTPDAQPAGGTGRAGVQHTGTDVIMDTKGHRVQAMVWDDFSSGPQRVRFSWTTDAAGNGTLNLPGPTSGNMSDPDVVMATYNGITYADIVYLATNSAGLRQTYWTVYKWDPGAQAFGLHMNAIPLGGTVRNHASPNIDSNDSGVVGIVWQESATEIATITVVSPSYPFPGYTYTQPQLTFADSYVFPARIYGAYGCTSTKGVLVTAAQGKPNPPILFNQSLSPDVAVGSTGITSVAYINSYAIPGASPVQVSNRLVVQQLNFRGDNCLGDSIDSYSWSEKDGASVGTPRIAASAAAANPTDVEVVLDWQADICEEGYGPRHYQEIRNFGKFQGKWRYPYTTVSIPYVVGTNNTETIQPVVSYYSYDAQEFYVVDWTGTDYQNGDAHDVWSRYLRNGIVLTPSAYSRVNDKDHLKGNQQLASVAARYIKQPFSAVHFFADENYSVVSYKYTTVSSGAGPLRPANTNQDGTQPATAPTSAPIQAYPNPSSSSVDFNLHLRKGETVRQLTVVDLMGRVLDQVAVPSSQSAEQVISWQPKQALPQGTYVVKLVTNQRAETITIGRNR